MLRCFKRQIWVNMINELIGVAIIGKEGTQAVNNADLAISRFCYLAPLLLVDYLLNIVSWKE